MRVLLFLFLFATSNTSSLAKTCKFVNDPTKTKIKWTAYKTAKKVGVNGEFSKINFTSSKKNNIEGVIKSAKFSINSQSVVTGDKARDTKIAMFFFKTMLPNQNIEGEVLELNKPKNKLKVKLTMNGVSTENAMDYKIEGNKFSASGVIDVLSFKMEKQHKALS